MNASAYSGIVPERTQLQPLVLESDKRENIPILNKKGKK